MAKPKDVELKARVTVAMKYRVEQIAQRRDESISVVVREALTEYLAKQPDNVTDILERTVKGVFKDSEKLSKAKPTKRLVGRLRDIREISLSIFGTIPAGWPDDRCGVKPKRTVKVPVGKYLEGAFGLDVVGESMNKSRGKFGPILDGETVVLLPPDLREPKHGDIVAALCDGQTTLKRLDCKLGAKCILRAESDSPQWKNSIKPAHELVIQGVLIGKL